MGRSANVAMEGDGGRAEGEFGGMKLSFSLLVLARGSAVSFLRAVQLGDEWVGVPWDAEVLVSPGL